MSLVKRLSSARQASASGMHLAAMRWVRSNPLPTAASATGLSLMAGSFNARGQLSALMLEVGAGLALVAIVFELERRMASQLEARQDEKFADLERTSQNASRGPLRPQQRK